MLKEFSIENWILSGTGFLLIFTLGCYLWFNNEMASIEQNYTDHKVGIQHTEKSTETGHVKTPHIEQIDLEEPDTPEEDSSAPEDTTDSISNASQLPKAKALGKPVRSACRAFTPQVKQLTTVLYRSVWAWQPARCVSKGISSVVGDC